MSPATQICSRCKSVVTAVKSPTGASACPRCQAPLGPPPSRPAGPPPGPLQPSRPVAPAAPLPVPAQPAAPRPAGPGPLVLALGAAAAVLLLLAFVGVGAVVLLKRGGSRPPGDEAVALNRESGDGQEKGAGQEQVAAEPPAQGIGEAFDPKKVLSDDALKGAEGVQPVDVPKPAAAEKHGMAKAEKKAAAPEAAVPAERPPVAASGQNALSLLPLEDKTQPAGVLADSPLRRRAVSFKVAAKAPRLAVLPGAYDDIGSILRRLGPGYEFDTVSPMHFMQMKTLAPYNVVFLNCGAALAPDLRVRANLRQYVAQGGTLYASDLQYHLLRATFQEYVPPPTRFGMGGFRQLQGNLTANVLDPGLRRVLGTTLDVRFDMVHMPALFNPKATQFYLSVPAGPNGFGGTAAETPLLARFRAGKGQVIFTSYHNSRNVSDRTLKLLLHIVFSAVNTEVERLTRQATLEGGFKQREANNLNLSRGDSLARQEVVRTAGGPLRFGVGFRDGAAQLRLRVFTPDGKVIEHADAGSFVLEIDDAPPGRWHYSVTAVAAPHDHFPFTLLIAER